MSKGKMIFSGSVGVFGLILVLLLTAGGAPDTRQPSATQVSNQTNEAIAQAAQVAYPTPLVQNFIERKTIQQWTERWDTPMIITYVYLFANENCIGYFVCDGKPASTRSYLEPEERYYMNGATIQTPSLDGTYGSDNPGWVFFTADNTAISWQGGTANCLFSDAPLPDLSERQLGRLKSASAAN